MDYTTEALSDLQSPYYYCIFATRNHDNTSITLCTITNIIHKFISDEVYYYVCHQYLLLVLLVLEYVSIADE